MESKMEVAMIRFRESTCRAGPQRFRAVIVKEEVALRSCRVTTVVWESLPTFADSEVPRRDGCANARAFARQELARLNAVGELQAYEP